MTKILNPAITRLAGRRHIRMTSQVRHVGRRSGQQYVTPVSARLAGNHIVIPLTFGSQSDWSRNVRAAGGCVIRLDGTDYRGARPRLADGGVLADAEVQAAFARRERLMFRLLGITRFLVLDVAARTDRPRA
jgi:deazaflavin-dependent oxidoreductase (nitroreductase family)